jgi:hypothetical protein
MTGNDYFSIKILILILFADRWWRFFFIFFLFSLRILFFIQLKDLFFLAIFLFSLEFLFYFKSKTNINKNI